MRRASRRPAGRPPQRSIAVAGAVLSLVFFGGARAQEGRPQFTTYLSVNNVRGLASDGARLWLATSGGAVSYDPATGDQRIFHRRRDGLLSDSVKTVAVAPDGRIWFGTDEAGISIFDRDSEFWEPYTSRLHNIPGDQINRIRFSQDSLFISARRGFTLFVGDEQPAFYLDAVSLGLPSADVRDITGSPDGNGLMLATAAGVVHRDSLEAYRVYDQGPSNPEADRIIRYRGGWIAAFGAEIRRLRLPEGIWEPLGEGGPQAKIHDLQAEGGSLYAAAADGLWRYDEAGGYSRLGGADFPANAIARGPGGAFYAGAFDKDDARNGLLRLEGDTWRRIVFPGPSIRRSSDNILAGGEYRALMFDAGGALHTSMIRPGTYQTFDDSRWSPPRALSWWAWDLLASGGGGLWLAHCCCTEEGDGCPLGRLAGGDTQTFPPRNLRDLAYDDRGNLWGASYGETELQARQGIWMLDAAAGEWRQFTTATPGAQIASDNAVAILPIGGRVWIGYADQGAQVWDLGADRIPVTPDDAWVAYGETQTDASRRLTSNKVTKIASLGSRVWIGSQNGLTVVDPDRTRRIFRGFNRLPADEVNAILPVADGGAWIGTTGGGVTRIAETEIGFAYAVYGPPDLPNPDVQALALDPDGRSVWIGTKRGLSRLTPVGSSGSPDIPVAVYPNPFVIGCGEGVRLYNVPGVVNGVVVDLSGKELARFERRGSGDLVWDGKDRNGRTVASGLYVIRLKTSIGTRGIGVGVVDGPCP